MAESVVWRHAATTPVEVPLRGPREPREHEEPSSPGDTGRFEFRRLLGRGGMGEVWLVRDPLLGRDVALKLLLPGRGVTPARFLREVKAQARVSHPNVCPVYEVGELAGRAYLVMPYLDGRPLDQVGARLAPTELAALAAGVAEGLHAAHRLGLVHRDVKPGNVLVVRGEGGALEPIVLDFGLAADPEGPRLTAVGTVLGTPAYMSPEQATGEPGSVDRRSDLYSLGASLWEILAQRPVHRGETAAEVMLSVLTNDPASLRSVAPAVPPDLGTIVMKCLERDPSRRYETARALADDLRRFVDGEPVLARPVSRFERFVRRARRNRLLTGVVASFGLLTLLLAGLGLRERVVAARRQEAAELFGREAERVEWVLREDRLLPMHDARPAAAKVRERMAWLDGEARRRGAAARGPAAYAQGRGLLALGELAPARERLEEARAGGVRSPELAFALGRALGGLYQRALRASDAIAGKEAREARRREIVALYRDPALAALAESRGALGAAPEWVEGLVALYENRRPQALAKAAEAVRRRPGLYEARELAAEVRIAEGREREEAGDWEGAKAAWAEAGRDYAAALEIARSDAALRSEEARRLLSLATGSARRGEETDAAFAAARSAVDAALAVDPEEPLALDVASLLGWRRADALARKGDSDGARSAYTLAAAQAATGTKRDPGSASLWSNLGIATWGLAEIDAARGSDPRALLGKAVEALTRAGEVEPGNPGPAGDLGSVLFTRAQWEVAHGLDAEPALAAAIRTGEKAVRLAPSRSAVHSNLASFWFALADLRAAKGGEAAEPVQKAVQGYGEALKRNPKNAYARNNLGEALLLLARLGFERSGAPGEELARAEESFTEATALNPKLVEARRGLASTWLLKARVRHAAAAAPAAELAGARGALAAALDLNPTEAATLTLLARSWRLEAEWALDEGRAAPRAVSEGLAAAAKARKADSSSAEAAVEEGRLLLARARAAGLARGGPDLDAARSAFEAARKANPRDPEPLVGLALLARHRAARDQGLALVGEALARNPRHPEALSVKEALSGASPAP